MFASIAKKMGRGHGHVEHQVGEVAAPLKAAYTEGLNEVRNEYVEKEVREAKRQELIELIVKQMTA